MQAHKFSFVALLLGGIAASFLMLLSKQELALMYLQERNLEKAEALYVDLLKNNKLKRADLSPLTRIYIEQGYPRKAIEVYENYLTSNPSDVKVEKQLAKLYFDSHRYYDYLSLLEKITENQPSLHNLDELRRLYYRYGKNKKEAAALQQLVALDPKRSADYRRLIELQSAEKNFVAAEETLAAYIDAENPMTPELAELRLRFLISAKNTDEALAWAKTWLDKHNDSVQRFIAVFYSGGKSSNLLKATSKAPAMDPNIMPAWLLRALVSSGWNERKIAFLQRFTGLLSKEKQQQFPVIMARVALSMDNKRALNKWLKNAEQLEEYDSMQMTTIAEIYLLSKRMDKALDLLTTLADQKVPSAFYTQTALFALKMGETQKGLEIFTQLKAKHQHTDIEYAWVLLSCAEGKSNVLQWLENKQAETLTEQQWLDLYYVAADRKHNELALGVANQYYKHFPGQAQKQLLAQATLKAGRNGEALTLLKERLKAKGLSDKERADLAYLLLKAGDKTAAVKQFQMLAQSEGPNGKSIEQLLYIWGPLPDKPVLDWLERQAKKARPSKLAFWWQHLIQVGGAKRVIAMAKSKTPLKPSAEQTYLSALISEGDISVLEWQLKKHASESRDTKRLERLAKTANSEGLHETEEYIWQRVIEIDPKNPNANLGLGLAAFSRDDRPNTETYLASYLKNSEGDWEAAFFLAEALYADGRHRNAEPYFKRSIEHINKKREPPKRQREARALMQYRLGETDTAMGEYDKLIAEFPQDKELRANYSTLLIDVGRFAKARRLLGEKL